MATLAEGTDAAGLASLENAIRELELLEDVPTSEQLDLLNWNVADLVAGGDGALVAAASDRLRALVAQWNAHERGGWAFAHGQVRALNALAARCAQRLPQGPTVTSVGADTHAHRMLETLSRRPRVGARGLADALGVNDTEVSRTAGILMRQLLVKRQKVGRQVFWSITPKGREVLDLLDGTSGDRIAGMTARSDGSAVTSVTPMSPAPSAASDALLRDVFSGEPVELDTALIERHLSHPGSPEELSRFLLLDVVNKRPETLTEKLANWSALQGFLVDEPRLFVAPPDAPAESLQEGAWRILQRLQDTAPPRDDWGPVEPPVWDAYAVVPGDDGKEGVVFIEAKNRPEEFRTGAALPKDSKSAHAAKAMLLRVSEDLGAHPRWGTLPKDAPDAAQRLVFLKWLQDHGVDAWVYNVYFYAPPSRQPIVSGLAALPESKKEWEDVVAGVRASLRLEADHPLAAFIGHDHLIADKLAP